MCNSEGDVAWVSTPEEKFGVCYKLDERGRECEGEGGLRTRVLFCCGVSEGEGTGVTRGDVGVYNLRLHMDVLQGEPNRR